MVPALPATQVLPVGPHTKEQEIQLQIFTAFLVSEWSPAHIQSGLRVQSTELESDELAPLLT